MDYSASLDYLKNVFLYHDFKNHQASKRNHVVKVKVDDCQSGTIITICFPGYKATPTVPDYRVDITKGGITTSLSHANIIVDITNKCTIGGMDTGSLKQALKSQAKNCNLNYAELSRSLPYNPTIPSPELLAEAWDAHGGKPFNEQGNKWNLTVEELFKSIKWIVLQEDINYPISKGFLGRKMPYARYLEAIHVLESNEHSLREVIQRAISHHRPPRWPTMDYSFEQAVR